MINPDRIHGTLRAGDDTLASLVRVNRWGSCAFLSHRWRLPTERCRGGTRDNGGDCCGCANAPLGTSLINAVNVSQRACNKRYRGHESGVERRGIACRAGDIETKWLSASFAGAVVGETGWGASEHGDLIIRGLYAGHE